ncbi:unnamed protein product [Owenia fusiformis]|uniref:Fibrous sheath-interacting protein 1 n=1 Tax=Owenia fusiformis TaxID=6347 RepID=A0A8S4PH79_OWEFU|nr:unnamed protein product [Owenia fusiformis]
MPKPTNRMDIEPGILADIARPPRNTSRTGSRASLNETPDINRRSLNNYQSIEVLPPDNYGNEEGSDIEVEDLTSSDNSDLDSDFEENMTQGAQGRIQISSAKTDDEKHNEMLQEYNSLRQLLPVGGDNDDDDVDSDEERDIIKQIRDEIKNQVKGEMKEELAQYSIKEKPEDDSKKIESDLDNLEPKIREGILKIRKYDRILNKRIKREKEVKKDRILLMKRLKEEIENIRPEGREEQREVKYNMHKFLALAPPPSHNEGVDLREDVAAGTPIFQTQFIDPDQAANARRHHGAKGGNTDSPSGATSSRMSDASTEIPFDEEDGDSKMGSSKHSRNKNHKKKKKDFLKRNIELASDAANTIAMTDDEKKHLEELLTDIDALPDLPEEVDNSTIDSNPFAVTVHPGEGYMPEETDIRRLTSIDSRLKELLPPEDFEQINSTPRSTNSQQSHLFTRTDLRSSQEVEKLGERALQEGKDNRDIKQRLNDIELELQNLTSAVELEIESPALSEVQLQDLLDQCSRTMSRVTIETNSLVQSPRSQASSRSSIYENPPKLPEATLQALLADARASLGTSRLSAVTEESNAITTPDTTRYLGDVTSRENITANEDNLVVESISEETLRELLKDSRTTSRSASRSSHSSIIDEYDLSNQSDTYLNNYSSRPTSSQSPRLKLPEINQNQFMSTQKLTNEIQGQRSRPGSRGHVKTNNEDHGSKRQGSVNSGRSSTNLLHNVLLSDSLDFKSDESPERGQSAHSPHPPGTGRKSSAGKQNRTYSPAINRQPSSDLD